MRTRWLVLVKVPTFTLILCQIDNLFSASFRVFNLSYSTSRREYLIWARGL
jgi:hypothetical protein